MTERYLAAKWSDYVRAMIAEMKKPRRICICGDFRDTGKEEMDWHKCECAGWMSAMQLLERR